MMMWAPIVAVLSLGATVGRAENEFIKLKDLSLQAIWCTSFYYMARKLSKRIRVIQLKLMLQRLQP